MTALIKNLTAMRDALEFYSNEENYIMPEKDGFILDSCAMEYDRGGAAKATLALFSDTLRMVQEMETGSWKPIERAQQSPQPAKAKE